MPRKLGRLLGDELVTRAVEAVLAEPELLAQPARQGVGVRVRRDGGVKRRVEDRDLRQVGIALLTGAHQRDRRRVVKRRRSG